MHNLKKVFIFGLFLLLISVGTVSAQGGNNNGSGIGGNNNTPPDPTSTNTTPSNIKLTNPLGSTDSVPELIEGILRIVLSIGTPLVALAIIYAGFKFVAAQGNPTKLQEDPRTLLYVIIGAAILLAAYVIAEAVVGTINAIRA